MKRVSIVIPNYNGEKYIGDCLNSIVNQVGISDEIIVIDNASTDNSLLILKEFPKVKVVELEKNFGFSYAVNCGINKSEGDYIFLLNNDTVVENGSLVHLISCIERGSKIFSVSSKMIRYYDRELIDNAGDQFTILGWAYKRGDGLSRKINFLKIDEVFSSCGGAALYRKNVFEQIGLFDERFFAYLEDVDIGYRARLYGFNNVFCPESVVYHIGSATTGSKYNDFKIFNTARNNMLLLYKNMPLYILLLNLPFICIGLCVKAVFYFKKGFLGSYLKGNMEAIKMIKSYKMGASNIAVKHLINVEKLLVKNFFEYVIYRFKKQRGG